MTLYDGIEDYLNSLTLERGLSRNTRSEYQARLRAFHRWLTENGYPTPSLSDFTPLAVRRFVYSLGGQGLRPRTTRGYLNALRGVGKFLVGVGALAENPSLSVAMPKLDAAERQTVSDAEVQSLLAACERLRNPRQMALARAVVSVFAFCGLRRSELLGLKTGDVDLKERWVLVRHCKGDKSRRVPLCPEAEAALREWVALRGECPHSWLFTLAENRRRLYENGLRSLWETVKATAGLRESAHVMPHGLRHGCATRLMRNGADLRTIQAFLGHSSLNVTAVYLHTDEERLRDVAGLAGLRVQQSRADEDGEQQRTARRRGGSWEERSRRASLRGR